MEVVIRRNCAIDANDQAGGDDVLLNNESSASRHSKLVDGARPTSHHKEACGRACTSIRPELVPWLARLTLGRHVIGQSPWRGLGVTRARPPCLIHVCSHKGARSTQTKFCPGRQPPTTAAFDSFSTVPSLLTHLPPLCTPYDTPSWP